MLDESGEEQGERHTLISRRANFYLQDYASPFPLQNHTSSFLPSKSKFLIETGHGTGHVPGRSGHWATVWPVVRLRWSHRLLPRSMICRALARKCFGPVRVRPIWWL